jgi:hypothetical protein
MRALRNKKRHLHFGHSTSRIRDLFVSVITPTEPLGENLGTPYLLALAECPTLQQRLPRKIVQPYPRRSRLCQQNQCIVLLAVVCAEASFTCLSATKESLTIPHPCCLPFWCAVSTQ